MKATYYKDTMRSYMILPCPPEAETEGYQYRMLEMNRIEGLLPCGLRYIDGERYLYYDITGKQSMGGLYEGRKIAGTELFKLLEDINRVSESLAGYLLDEQHLVLSREQVFYDFATGSHSFTYYPGIVTEPEIFRFLADGIDGTDKRAAAAAYRLCSVANGDRQSLRGAIREEAAQKDDRVLWGMTEEPQNTKTKRDRALREDLEERIPEKESGSQPPQKEKKERPFKAERDQGREEQPWDKKQLLLRIFLILMLLGGAGGLFAVPFLLYISQREQRLCIAGAILSLAAACLLAAEMFLRRQKIKKKSREEEENREPVYSESDEKDLPQFGTSSKEEYRIEAEAGNTIRFSEQETIGRLYGRDRGSRIDLRTLPVTVGKVQAYADVVLPDPSVSRVHARIYKGEDGCIEVRDLDSTNGTWINGVRLGPNEKVRVQRGDEIRFGNMEYEYR